MRRVLHEHTTWKFIGSISASLGGGRSHSAWFRQRRNHRHPRRFALLAQTMETESRTRRTGRPRPKIRFRSNRRTHAGAIAGTQNDPPRRSQSVRLSNRPLDLADRRRPHSKKMERRLLWFQCPTHPAFPGVVVSKTGCQVNKALSPSHRTLAAARLASHKKKPTTTVTS